LRIEYSGKLQRIGTADEKFKHILKLNKMKTEYYKYLKIYKNHKISTDKKRFIWSRYYLDDYEFTKRIDFVLNQIKNHAQREFICEIKYWEDNNKMENFLQQLKTPYSIVKEYKNGKKCGIIVINDKKLDIHFFKNLLINHYNYELAYEPALSVKIMLFINYEDYLMAFDFYDDRGFIINYYFY
jgi:hypothetical protein